MDQLRQELANHVVHFDKHVARFDAHVVEEHHDRVAQRKVQQTNAENIAAMTTAVTDLTITVQAHIEATAPIIQLQQDLTSAARIGHRVMDFVTWSAKAGALMTALGGIVHYAITHLPKH